ncbi:MAG: hypothetical protein JWP58_2130 [Hymenobacter sp.]|nr:hypothetical protein [Hymenobacter sp.]
MRAQANNNQLAVRAIAGTYVVLLAYDLLTEAARSNFLGFAIYRADLTAGKGKWLQGYRVFEQTVPQPELGKLYSSQQHPVQDFLWGDYAAHPGNRYRYRVVPLYGTPAQLEEGAAVDIDVETERVDTGTHAIYFNRGAAGSQAYASRFGDKSPDDVPDNAAYTWLSRGLEEAMLAFIAQANGPEYALRASVYEFSYEPVMKAFKAAIDAGADVEIIYDNRATDAEGIALRDAVRAAVKAHGLEANVKPRTTNPNSISHNKFIVLARKEPGKQLGQDAPKPEHDKPEPEHDTLKPEQVWTGSTNFSKGGIFGHSNVGHVVRDAATAQAYLDYWQRLWSDPEVKPLCKQNETATPLPAAALASGISCLFSPRFNRSGKAVPPPNDALDWYIDRIATAKSSVFFTSAFGINERIQKQLRIPVSLLRYVLMESYGNKAAAQKLELLRQDKTLRFAAGAILNDRSALHNWLQKERLTELNEHVKFIHTKYLLIDPLSESPLVATGSANFSDASVGKNDENMLLIYGDKRVADIYLGEFMRLFQHYQFRELARRVRSNKPQEQRAAFLDATGAWLTPWFTKDTPKYRQRQLFAYAPNPA